MWMIKSESGELFAPFRDRGLMAIGWAYLNDLSQYASDDDLRAALVAEQPDAPQGRISNAVAVIRKFRSGINVGDKVVTFDPISRMYLIGEVTSEYVYEPTALTPDHPHIRRVNWGGTLVRDVLSAGARNSLGSALTLFSVNEDIQVEINAKLALAAQNHALGQIGPDDTDVDIVQADESAKALELIKDSIVSLTPRQLEELIAALLRAMGYRATVTPEGPDRGVDVYASPDGLMLEEPRIKAEVKHRPGVQTSAPVIRGFVGALRQGDRGIFVSTGGFTREARYEADRSMIPVSLVELNRLAELVVEHYESFNLDGRLILPLVRIYIPER